MQCEPLAFGRKPITAKKDHKRSFALLQQDISCVGTRGASTERQHDVLSDYDKLPHFATSATYSTKVLGDLFGALGESLARGYCVSLLRPGQPSGRPLRVPRCRTTVGRSFILLPTEHSPEIAIPRLARLERQPSKLQTKHRDRVPRACRNCHKRKVKCSGGLPRCNFCEKVNKPCVYEATRKDRLATATDRNEYLLSLLKDLSGRVDDEDRIRIESALNDSDDDYDSPEPSSAGRSIRFYNTSYSQHSDFSRRQSRSQTSPLPTFYTPETEGTSPALDFHSSSGRHDSNFDLESLFDDATQAPSAHETGYIGQICEVRWLQGLKARLQKRDSKAPASSPQLSETNFHLDDHGIQLLNRDNPFHLPAENIATVLFQCYFQTVHITFPIIPADIENQLQMYYHSMRSGHAVTFPQRWYAIVNLVLAISARFSRLINAEWYTDSLDETLYISRAYQLLGLNDTAIVLAAPNLSLIQASGLLAFYYMAIGHVNRAWVMVGTSMRLALAYGLHTHSQTSFTDPNRKQVMIQTWWSIHNLDILLGSLTGRPNMLQHKDITTPFPIDVAEQGHQKEPMHTQSLSFPDAQVRLAIITQEVMSKLYTEQREVRSWAQIQAIITSTMSELDDWAQEAMPQHWEESQALLNQEVQQIMLKKQYCRLKIMITRLSLRRLERCLQAGTADFTSFDLDAAEACIQTAQDVAALLPDDVNLKIVYEKGPWWTIMHNIMQATSILLIGISCRKYLEQSYTNSVASVKKFVTYLQHMRDANESAKRAYGVLYNIVKAPDLANPAVWKDVVDFFPTENTVQPPPPPPQEQPHLYLPWAAEEQYQGEGYGYYQIRPV